MAVEKHCLMECILCGRPHAVRAGFSDGRSCVKCGGSLNYKGPITILSPPGSAMIRDVRRVMPVSIETDTKQLDAALAKALKLEDLLDKCKKKSAAVAASIVTVKDQEEG